jgi:hypothetical protein
MYHSHQINEYIILFKLCEEYISKQKPTQIEEYIDGEEGS